MCIMNLYTESVQMTPFPTIHHLSQDPITENPFMSPAILHLRQPQLDPSVLSIQEDRSPILPFGGRFSVSEKYIIERPRLLL